MESEREDRPESLRQKPGVNKAAETQLSKAKQELESAERRWEETIQGLEFAKGMKLSAEMRLKVAVQVLRRTMDLTCPKGSTEANAAEEGVDSTTNLHTDHTHPSKAGQYFS